MDWYDMAMESLEEDFAEGLISKQEFEQEVRHLNYELRQAKATVNFVGNTINKGTK